MLIENKKITKELDSLLRLKNVINDSINKEIIQEELDELSSKVYFYGGTTKIRQFSDEQLNKIVDILQKNKNLEVEVRGYYNGDGNTIDKVYNTTIDIARAEAIKQLLIDKGLNYNTISAVGMGQSTIDDAYSFNDIVIDGEEFKWNRNMRVEIKLMK